LRGRSREAFSIQGTHATGEEGEVFDELQYPFDDRLGAPVRVLQDYGKAAEALNQ